ncbi:bifunctional 2-polyprenyl-6-hydroxyphenol methylase/3-demethylubiquinol 3-O-methyltransferase UbiG [Actinoplanes sp. TFC3]|uniref:class I SAM-dependent methyltransferase n=1 Tax=Actinoplanes sp. TFC3 TaxID=1710355 RepID=UPI0009E76D3B|nr:class I SAM-dependent methyltransferase [Actinoplanes sp. TFC3]
MHDEASWDARYAESERIFSGEPNVAFVGEVADLTPGTALELGCGEGADAVWLALKGWTVTAVDISGVALAKAAGHAQDAGVSIVLQRHDLTRTFPGGTYDLVTSQFLYSMGDFPREAILRRAAAAVNPGGVLLIESHQDFGGHHSDETMRFPLPGGLIDDLHLNPDEWQVLRSDTHDRLQNGPDGRPGHRVDGTVKLRRSGQRAA